MTKYISISVYSLFLVVLVIGFGFFGSIFSMPSLFSIPFLQNNATPVSPSIISTSQQSDMKLAQHNERSNSQGSSGSVGSTAALAAPGAALLSGCNLGFSMVPTTKTTYPGGMIDYNIVLKNNGSVECRNTSFSVYYSDDEKFVSSTPVSSAGNYYWVVGALPSGAEYKLSLKTKNVGSDDEMRSEACATADNAVNDVCAESHIVSNNGETPQDNSETEPLPSHPVTQNPVLTNTSVFAPPQGKEFGTWIWESPSQMESGYANHIVEEAKKENINVVYVTVDDYIAIAGLVEGSAKKAKKDSYFRKLSEFITLAKTNDIEVDVVGGWRDWAISKNRWKGYALINMVDEYNRLYPQSRIRNLQYDVEPYLLSTYENNKAGVLKAFVEFIDESAVRMQNVDAGFSIVIPHFYDSEQKWTPLVSYKGKSKHTYTHLLDILEKKPGSAIILMSYRDFFEGEDGTRDISEPEIKEASFGNYATLVLVAQETGNVEPDYVTFFGQSKSELNNALVEIYSSFSGYSKFGGVAVHYIDPFLELK